MVKSSHPDFDDFVMAGSYCTSNYFENKLHHNHPYCIQFACVKQINFLFNVSWKNLRFDKSKMSTCWEHHNSIWVKKNSHFFAIFGNFERVLRNSKDLRVPYLKDIDRLHLVIATLSNK